MADPADSSTRHWRRHDEAYLPAGKYTSEAMRDALVAASACGRLVDYQQAICDPSEADCSECGAVWVFVAMDREDLAQIIAAYNQRHSALKGAKDSDGGA